MNGLWGAAIWLTGTLAVGLCLFRTFWEFLGVALATSAKFLGPRQVGAPDPRIPPVGVEPAYRAYWSRQMWIDARSAAVASARAVRHRLTSDWLGVTTRRLFRGRTPAGNVRPGHGLARLVLRVIAPGTALGALAGALAAALVVFAVHLVLWVLLGITWLSVLLSVVALRTSDRLGALGRGIHMKCPFPGCYRAFPLAVHRCPGCGAPHRALRPSRFGALWHVCVCGRRLATTSFTGRNRLRTGCPHCDQRLPQGIGGLRVVHVPILGGTSSGKTMLMAAAVAGMRSWSGESRLTVEYASTEDHRESTDRDRQLAGSGWALKTQGGQQRAFMLRVTCGRRRRLLYLYDPMGESLRDAAAVREQQYLAHADGVILAADVLADPQVRRTLTGADAEHAREARPSDQGPLDTYQRLTGELAALTGRRRRLPAALVVTKRDALDRIPSLRVPPGDLGGWLEGIGLGSLVRGLGHDFGVTRFWAVSSYAATGTGALPSEQRRAAEPVLWMLARSGLRVHKLLVGASAIEGEGGPRHVADAHVPGPRDEPAPDRSAH